MVRLLCFMAFLFALGFISCNRVNNRWPNGTRQSPSSPNEQPTLIITHNQMIYKVRYAHVNVDTFLRYLPVGYLKAYPNSRRDIQFSYFQFNFPDNYVVELYVDSLRYLSPEVSVLDTSSVSLSLFKREMISGIEVFKGRKRLNVRTDTLDFDK